MLELFVDSEEPLTSSEVARRLRVPRTTALRILMTLCEQGLLSRHGNGFMPSSKLFRLGDPRAQLVEAAEVRDADSSAAGAADGRDHAARHAIGHAGAGVGRVRRPAAGPHRAGPGGALLPLHCTTAGKVMLAFSLRPRLEAMVSKGLESRTPNTLTTLAELEAELNRVTQLGYAVDDEECYEGVRCLAAPVYDASGAATATVGIIASASTFRTTRTSTSPPTSSGPPASSRRPWATNRARL